MSTYERSNGLATFLVAAVGDGAGIDDDGVTGLFGTGREPVESS